MTATTPGTYDSSRHPWANGVAVFGGSVLIVVGVFQFFEGLSAVLNDKVYVSTPAYAYKFDLTAWGWIHLLLGVLTVVVGAAILAGQTWAVIIGIIIAGLSAMTQFMFLPWQPLWALIIIGIDVAVIWALATKLGEGRPD